MTRGCSSLADGACLPRSETVPRLLAGPLLAVGTVEARRGRWLLLPIVPRPACWLPLLLLPWLLALPRCSRFYSLTVGLAHLLTR